MTASNNSPRGVGSEPFSEVRAVTIRDLVAATVFDSSIDTNDVIFRTIRACKQKVESLALEEFLIALEASCEAAGFTDELIDEYVLFALNRFDEIEAKSTLEIARDFLSENDSRVILKYERELLRNSLKSRMTDVATLVFHLEQICAGDAFLSCRDCGELLGVSHTLANTLLNTMVMYGFLEKVGDYSYGKAQCWKLGTHVVIPNVLGTLHTNTQHTNSHTHNPPPTMAGGGGNPITGNLDGLTIAEGITSVENIVPFTPIMNHINQSSGMAADREDREERSMNTYTCERCKQEHPTENPVNDNTALLCEICTATINKPVHERNRHILLETYKNAKQGAKSEQGAKRAVCCKVADLLNLPVGSTSSQLLDLFESHGFSPVMKELIDIMNDPKVYKPIAVLRKRCGMVNT